MEKDTHKTAVVFRKFKDGDIIALFPKEINDYHGNCMSYMHVGQHGAANYAYCVDITTLAKPKEYKSLKVELENVGYNLNIRKKYIKAKK